MNRAGKNGKAISICWDCQVPCGQCEYLVQSRLGKPYFYPGSRHQEKIVTGGLKVYVMEFCPAYIPPDYPESDAEFAKTTEEEQEEIYALRQAGVSVAKIVKEYGLSQTTIYRVLRKMKKANGKKRGGQFALTLDKRRELYERWLKGEDAKRLAAEYGVSCNTVYNVIRRSREAEKSDVG